MKPYHTGVACRQPVSTYARQTRVIVTVLLTAMLWALTGATAALAQPGVTPASVDAHLDPGSSTEVTKTVTTSEVPPNPDVVFLADTTGSMGGEIANVKSNVTSIISDVTAASPTAQFGVAQYRDTTDSMTFNLDQAMTDDATAIQTAVNSWSAGGGGDTPEAQLYALHQLANPALTGWRADSTRIIAWFGDAPGHDPSNGVTEGDATNALTGADIRVVAVSTGFNDLDGFGQATRITDATDGVLLSGVNADDVSAAILDGIQAIEVTVTPNVIACDDGLSLAFDPASQTVTSGDDATFTETISVAGDAEQGATLSCTVEFLVDGLPQGDAYTQTVTIGVNDVTAPVAACSETTNPGGRNVPRAGPGANPNSGQNPDGFYQLDATDNLDASPELYVTDTGSGTVFGPFEPGTTIKYTQNADATPEQKPMGGPNSAIDWHIIGTGDARVVAVDSSGNESAPVDCLVPAPPK